LFIINRNPNSEVAMTRSLLFAFSILIVLTAGADTPRRSDTGWRITLQQPLEIGPGEASARLQYGRVVPRNGVQEFDPHCIFEIETVTDTPRILAPGSFRVSEIQRRVETHSGMPVFPWHYRSHWHDRSPSQLYYITQFRLLPNNDTPARRLICQHDQANPGFGMARHLSPTEIRQALGNLLLIASDL